MAEVTQQEGEFSSIKDTNKVARKSIGINGSSGHSVCMKFSFTAFNWTGLNVLAFINGLSGHYINVYRADASIISGFELLSLISYTLMAPFTAWIQDKEIFGSCFEAVGCNKASKKTADGKIKRGWGRRAPHTCYSVLVCVIATFFVFSPTNWANMATKMETSGANARKIEVNMTAGNTVTWWQYHDGDNVSTPDLATIQSTGFDCSKPLTYGLADGTVIALDTVLTATGVEERGRMEKAGEQPQYGNNICSTFVSLKSVCWPGPAGHPTKVGDGGPRVCSFIDSNSLGGQFLILTLITNFFVVNMYQAGASAIIEVYPWKEERVHVTGMGLFWFLTAIIFWIVLLVMLTTNSELGASPTGAQSFRLTIVSIVAISNLFGFLAINPQRDALQHDGETTKGVCQEYYELLKSSHPSARAIKWTLYTQFCEYCYDQTRLVFGYAMILYVQNVPLVTFGTVVGISVVAGIFTRLLMVPIWTYIFGRKSKDGREKGKDPRMTMLVWTGINCILIIIIIATLLKPLPRDTYGNGINYMLWAVYWEIYHSFSNFWNDMAKAWAMDEDIHYYATVLKTGKRRETVVNSLTRIIGLIGNIMALILYIVVMGTPDSVCDTKLASLDMDQACPDTVWMVWMIVIPLFTILKMVGVYFYPITGKRLEELYLKQAEVQLAVEGTASFKTVKDEPVVQVVREENK